ncbi:hypothetical protein [Herpetosiphon sp. NSE202]|uniref:hypothetical protein n=1 Tax=Herpetosiphon sp. NSE202 TaxID=3351349 RepID=UPI00362AB7E5
MIANSRIKLIGLVALGTLLGAIGAFMAYQARALAPSPEQLKPYVWAVVAVPFGSFLGSLLGQWRLYRPFAGWLVLTYVLSLFAAARLERIFVGQEAAVANGHASYLILAIILQSFGALLVAWRLSAVAPAAPTA